MSDPPGPDISPLAVTAATRRQQIRRILAHIAGRIELIDRLEEYRDQLVAVINALIPVFDDPHSVDDDLLEELLAGDVNASRVRQLIAPLADIGANSDYRVTQEFIDLFTAALMLERSSFGTGAARRSRYTTKSSEIRAVVQLGSMLQRADQARDRSGLPDLAIVPSREQPQTVNFWQALSASQQQALTSVAQPRTFAAGATLMREGEEADHVIVIRRGWTKICVNDNGRERVIAERGPGQLIGERAAFQVSVRSATVIALDTVRALVVKTDDFVGFAAAHPAVLKIIEGQVYERLTGDTGGSPGRYGGGASGLSPPGLPASRAGPGSSHLPAGRSSGRRQPLRGEHCTVILTDVVGFGARDRSDEDRRMIRDALFEMTQVALGPWWDDCVWEDRGDGLVVAVPTHLAAAEVIDHVFAGLRRRLKRHNHIYGPSLRIQLRAAVDIGPVASNAMGLVGNAIVLAARLLDAPALKTAIAESGADLGVIVSAFAYESAVRHAGGAIDPLAYQKVQVTVKGRDLPGWMQLTDPRADTRRRDRAAARPLQGENCTVVLTDVAAFGARYRDDEDRRIIRNAVFGMTQAALESVWPQCHLQDRGDGLLIVVPPNIATTEVITKLHQALPAALRRHNRMYAAALQIQLRVAVNVGPVISDPEGLSGEAIIVAARLCDAPVLKQAITNHHATLGMIVSKFVYETSIRHADSIDPAAYREVQVIVKESRFPAWMQLADWRPRSAR
jgi:Cyclic nucleotide-binding domain